MRKEGPRTSNGNLLIFSDPVGPDVSHLLRPSPARHACSQLRPPPGGSGRCDHSNRCHSVLPAASPSDVSRRKALRGETSSSFQFPHDVLGTPKARARRSCSRDSIIALVSRQLGAWFENSIWCSFYTGCRSFKAEWFMCWHKCKSRCRTCLHYV